MWNDYTVTVRYMGVIVSVPDFAWLATDDDGGVRVHEVEPESLGWSWSSKRESRQLGRITLKGGDWTDTKRKVDGLERVE